MVVVMGGRSGKVVVTWASNARPLNVVVAVDVVLVTNPVEACGAAA
jgi:hypothetical protein